MKRLRNKEEASIKVLWMSHLVKGASWEAEADMKSPYPNLFPSTPLQYRGKVVLLSFVF